jgi:arylsulfatase A
MKSIFTCLTTLGMIATPLAAAAKDQPNLIVILVDDLGYADIGPFGATAQKTPQLDKMAAEGLKLTSFYAAPVCSVARAQLLTGCYGARVSVPGVFFPEQPVGLNPAETTVAEHLKTAGYTTHCIGKWHLGDQPEFLPTRQGFDHYFGIPYSNDMQRVSKHTGKEVVPLMRDETVTEQLTNQDQSRIVERYTDEAESFIRTHRSQPFFLYLAHNAVHVPIQPGDRFRGKSANGRFGDWVEEVDWSVGRILATLKETGLDDKTLVVFTSDNGPWLTKGADGGSAAPLRGGKGGTWEGGVRVPTLVRWPGRIASAGTCDAVAGLIDLLPTFVRLAGGKLPARPVIDGRDLTPVLLGQSHESPREAHFYFDGYELQAVRRGPWKLAIATQRGSLGGRTDPDSLTHPRLYHLGSDIGERHNVAKANPDIVRELSAMASTLNTEIGGKRPAARRPAGHVDKPRALYPSTPKPAKAKAQTHKKPASAR